MIGLQTDAYYKLLAETALQNWNIVLLRDELFASEIAVSAVWQTPRNGKAGGGIIVGMPLLTVEDPDAPGPELTANLIFTVLEQPDMNTTGLFSEDVVFLILQILHEFATAQNCTLYAKGSVVTPNRDFEGIRGYNVRLEARLAGGGAIPAATPVITFAADTATITCATGGAAIYYTTDGSFPSSANAAAQVYAAPVAVASGATVRAAAYANNFNGSNVTQAIAP
jgi:hypothetical protein